MEKSEQKEIIESLCDSLKARMLKNIDRLPEVWNGVELRWYMKDIVDEEFTWGDRKPLRKPLRKVFKEYKNHRIVNNL